jgi:hypothetical protein
MFIYSLWFDTAWEQRSSLHSSRFSRFLGQLPFGCSIRFLGGSADRLGLPLTYSIFQREPPLEFEGFNEPPIIPLQDAKQHCDISRNIIDHVASDEGSPSQRLPPCKPRRGGCESRP